MSDNNQAAKIRATKPTSSPKNLIEKLKASIATPNKANDNLAFRSLATGTLPTNEFFHHEKKMEEVKSTMKKEAEAAQKEAALAAAAARAKAPVRKGVQPGAFGSARHKKRHPTASQQSTGVAKINSLLDNMKLQSTQPFPPYYPNMHAKNMSIGSSSNRASSSPQSLNRLVDYRIDEQKKDVIIDAGGVWRNLVRNCPQKLSENGRIVIDKPADYKPGDILDEIAAMDDAAKKIFWQSNVIQIDVDVRELANINAKKNGAEVGDKGKGKEVVERKPNVTDQLRRLDLDFFKHATDVHVSIIFPAPNTKSLAPRVHTRTKKDGKWIYPDHTITIGSAGFALVEDVAEQIHVLSSLISFDVILHNAHASSTVPFTLEQLYYALPFYDLKFTEWQLKWTSDYMVEACEVGGFPLILLDKERTKWVWEKEKAARKAQRRKAQREKRRINAS